MEPTLFSDNILITERISTRFHRISRGDIIIAKSPSNPAQLVCKRVVGLPGDRIIVRPAFNLNPFSNSKKTTSTVESVDLSSVNESSDKIKHHEDDYVSDHHNLKKLKRGEFVVPRGHVWIEGDNSANSSDSRYYGPIPQGLIRSRAVCRLWPLTDMKML